MDIKRYADASATAIAVAEAVFVQGTQGSRPINVAISGGSTPRLLFELMSQSPLREAIRWEQLNLYWVDERCVPPSDEQSNYKMTNEALLSHVPIQTSQIHRIKGEQPPNQEAQRYTTLVRQSLRVNDAGLPVFDYILLGIGDDGHTSSIFPHQMQWLDEPTPYVVAQHPNGQNRIALTGPTILAADKVVFHVVGESKGKVLSQIRECNPEALKYPSTHFFMEREDIELYTDQKV